MVVKVFTTWQSVSTLHGLEKLVFVGFHEILAAGNVISIPDVSYHALIGSTVCEVTFSLNRYMLMCVSYNVCAVLHPTSIHVGDEKISLLFTVLR